MEHAHHAWLSRVHEELQAEYVSTRASLKEGAANIQHSGMQAEATWISVLEAWLPPQYSVGTRKHLLFEREVEGKSRSEEVDIVIYHPSYPDALRRKADVMIAGVLAAFSVKLTLRAAGLREAIAAGARWKRGIKPRSGQIIGELVSPLVVGVLAQAAELGSHSEDRISELLEEGFAHTDHPSEELDLVCVADSNCWHLHREIVGRAQVEYERTWLRGWNEAGPMAPPVAAFVSELWTKLAKRDIGIRPIADGLQSTDTTGRYFGVHTPSQPVKPLISEQTVLPRLWANERLEVG